MHRNNERGIALITTLMVMMLMSALLVGFTAVVMSDQRYRFIDRDRGQAFYAASGGLEKMTADLGNLFLAQVAPTAAQLSNLTTSGSQPTIANVTFTGPLAPETLPTSSLTRCVAPNTVGVRGIDRLHDSLLRGAERQPDDHLEYADQDRPLRGTGGVADAVSARHLGADVDRR